MLVGIGMRLKTVVKILLKGFLLFTFDFLLGRPPAMSLRRTNPPSLKLRRASVERTGLEPVTPTLSK